MLRFVQAGLGPIGRSIARLAALQPGLKLVGAADPSVAGRELGALLGTGSLSMRVAEDVERICDETRPQLVLHATGSRLAPVAGQLRPLLRRGLHVVSTCEELAYPFYRHPTLAGELDTLARKFGAVLLGTGVNPGFVLDKLIVTLIACCSDVRSVRGSRIVDAASRRESFQRKIGCGLPRATFTSRVEAGELGHVGLAESAHMVADASGTPAAGRRLHETIEPVIARRRVESDCIVVEPGQVAGLTQSAVVEAAGREHVRLELEMVLGAPRPRDTLQVDAAPPIDLELASGVAGDEATAAIVAHCAARIADLAPGLHTMLEMPLRPASSLR